MAQREVGPRVGNSYSNRTDNDVDIQAFIERTPKTNEQINREKANTGWEYSVWMIVIIGIVIVLLVLVLWFLFKKDEITEVQKQSQPAPRIHQEKPKAEPKKEDDKKKEDADDLQDEKLSQEARDSLAKKKVSKREIGPVPGIIPDNPSVVGLEVPPAPKPVEPTVPDSLAEIQSTAVLNRLTTNFGLTTDN